MDSQKVQEKKRRLIVLLPGNMAYDFELAHMIHWMAFQRNRDVVYLTKEDENDGSLALSRDMATMNAVTAGNCLRVQWIQAGPTDWLARLQEIYQSDDEIICSEDQTLDHDLFGKVKFYHLEKESTTADVHPVFGFYPTHEVKREKRIPEFLVLIGFLVIIALFTWLQIQVDGVLQGTLSTVIVLILLCVEFGAIWMWNKRTFN
jgi:hypothetical protein